MLDILAGERQFLREGPVSLINFQLEKSEIPSVNYRNKEKEKRYSFLFNDLCIVAKPTSNGSSNKVYKPMKIISLNQKGTLVEELDQESTGKKSYSSVTNVRFEICFQVNCSY
jgi:hypothetical protein